MGRPGRWSRRRRPCARWRPGRHRPRAPREALAIEAARDAVVEQLSPRHVVIAGERMAALLADLARAGLPVEIGAGLRAEPADAARSAALAGGVAETAWVALEALRRI